MKVPFSVFDFFSYISAGAVLLAAAEIAAGRVVPETAFTSPRGLAILILAIYIAGHLISGLSSGVLEQWVARRLLGPPEDTLLSEERPRWRFLFPAYRAPLPVEIRLRVLGRATLDGFSGPGRGLFLHCHSLALRTDRVAERLAIFASTFTFCRNICMAALLGVILIATAGHGWTSEERIGMLALSVVALGMFLRYLTFYRHFTSEVLRSYSANR